MTALMPEPKRHPSVPDSAKWDEEKEEFCDCALDEDGKRHGDARWFRPDGTRASECAYVHGKAHGPYVRFHQNGEVSQRGEKWHDESHGVIEWIRSTEDTTEATVPDGFDDRIWRIQCRYDKGVAYPNRFFDREGNQVCQNGEPAPKRPDNVDAGAEYSVEEERWFFGRGSNGHEHRDGPWRWWTDQGVLRTEKLYKAGVEHRAREFREDGTLCEETLSDAEGNAFLQRRFSADGTPQTSGGGSIPARPQSVATQAVFECESGRWFLGTSLEPGAPRVGTWRWWGEDGQLRKEETYGEDKARTTRDYFEDTGTLFHEVVKNEEGKRTRNAYFFRDGTLNNAVDQTFEDGERTQVEVHVAWGLRSRATRAGEVMKCVFFDSDGQENVSGQVRGRKAVGDWTFEIGDQTFKEDVTEHGLRARIDDDDFDPQILLGYARFDQATQGDPPEQLEGVDEIDWANTPGCYSRNVDAFPAYLQALTSPLAPVRRVALSRISSEVLHQGSVYVATAQVIPFLARLLDHENVSAASLLSFVEVLASSAAPYAEDAVEWAEADPDDDDAKAVLGTLRAVEENFGQFANHFRDPECRELVLALAAYGGDAGRDILTTVASGEDPAEAAVAVDSLLQLDDTEPSAAEPYLRHETELVRSVAALRAARTFGPHAPPQTIEVLKALLANPDAVREDFGALPFVDGQLLAYLAIAIASMRNEETMALVGDLAKQMPAVNLFNLEPFCEALFVLSFANGQLPFAGDFLAVFDALAVNERLDGFANFSSVARKWNLPTDRRVYRELAESLRAVPDPQQAMHDLMHGDDDE